ncbi:MFS transporter [Aquimarina sediminis]|uniref:MFS transporter n=1 Tax=Aquimarina sediminis TaxID=2070536 RepID=UPI000CA0816B|nr:MFS transporter [Aquimarina sediminis]
MLLNKKVTLSYGTSPHLKGALHASGIMAFAGLGDAILYPILPIYGKELGFSMFFIGILLSINRFVRIIANTHIANLIRKIGVKKVLIITSIMASITTLTYGLELGGVIAFLIARVLWGLSYSGLKMSTLSYASKSKEKSGLAFGLSQSVKSLGPIFVLWLGPNIINKYGMQIGLFITALVSMLGILLAYSLPDLMTKVKIPVVKTKNTFHPSAINLLVFVLSIAIDGILVVTLSNTLSGNYANQEDLLVYVAFYLLLKRLFMLLFSMCIGFLTLKIKVELIFSVAVVFCVIALLLVAFNKVIIGIVIAFLCNTVIVTFSPLIAIKKQRQDNPLQAISGISTWWDLGAAIGALIGLHMIETLGMQYLFLSLSIITLVLFIKFNIQNAKSNYSTI